jgi:regulator of protease activity HflC (stomatin/prohibitin superfamily)
MNARDQAAQYDRADQPVEAAAAYEQVIAEGEADLETFLNLAVLYFQCCDGGYLARHSLSKDFVEQADKRALELLDEAENRYGSNNELEFWRLFINYAYGADASAQTSLELALRGPSSVPYFHLFSLPGGEAYAEEARMLLASVREGKTAKERFIKSVLESHANDSKWRLGNGSRGRR